jgi:hypothetical protein
MRTRPIILALTAIAATTGVWTAAQANPVAIVGGVVASVVGTAINNHNQPKLASCTLYDQDGRPVQVSCPADAPGAMPPPGKAGKGRTGPELAGGPPPVAAQAQVQYQGPSWDQSQAYAAEPAPAQMTYLSGGMPEARCISCNVVAPPPPPPRPSRGCGCEGPAPMHDAGHGAGYREEYRGADVYQPRAVASFLDGAVVSGRSSASYSRYEESSEQVSGYYEQRSGYAGGYGYGAGGPAASVGGYSHGGDRYGASADGYAYGQGYGQGYGQTYESGYASGAGIGYGQDGGVGGYDSYSYGGFYPYGADGYQNGGFANGYRYGARVSGRDPNGFLTWPGKR